MFTTDQFTLRHLIAVVVFLGAATIAIVSPAALGPSGGITLAIVLVTLGLWATALVPGYFASLLFFASVLIAGLQPAPLVFSGFASAAVWLIISGFVIGAAVNATGLDGRLAGVIAPLLTRSYPRLLGGLMLAAMLLGFGPQERLTVGKGNLVIIRVDFGEGQEAVAVAAIIDEGGLKRRFYARDLGKVDIAADLLLVFGFEVEFFYAVPAYDDNPRLLSVRRIDKHFLCHVD